MFRYAVVAALLAAAVTLPSAPSYAINAKEKMATCKFGADDQKLTGAARSKFMKRCMSNQDDPRGPAPMSAGDHAPPPPPPPQH
jgi:hypothetical protein